MQEYFDYSGFEEITPEITEKKSIKKMASACGIGLLLLFGVMYFWSYFYLRVAVLMGISPKSAVNLVTNPFISQIFSIVISFFMIVLPFLIISKVSGISIFKDISYRKPENGYFLPTVAIGVAFCLFSSFATDYGSNVFTFFGIEFPYTEQSLPKGIFGFIAVVISTAVFPAILEEFTMRGMVLGILRKKGDAFGIICSAFVFGIMHANANQIVFAFLVGLVLGFITIKTNSIWPSITVHFINNFISVAFSYAENADAVLTTLIITVLFALLIISAIFSVIYLQNKNHEFFSLKSNGEISEARKIKWFILSPLIITATVLSLLIAFFVR